MVSGVGLSFLTPTEPPNHQTNRPHHRLTRGHTPGCPQPLSHGFAPSFPAWHCPITSAAVCWGEGQTLVYARRNPKPCRQPISALWDGRCPEDGVWWWGGSPWGSPAEGDRPRWLLLAYTAHPPSPSVAAMGGTGDQASPRAAGAWPNGAEHCTEASPGAPGVPVTPKGACCP